VLRVEPLVLTFDGDARDPSDPKANEIDMRYTPKGGLSGSSLPPHLRLRLETLLWQVRRGALEYARRGVIAAHDVVQACNTALMLLYANLLDLRNVFDIFRLVIDTEGELSLDVDAHHPNIAQKKEFSEYRRQVEILRGLLAEGKNNMDSYMNLLAYQAKCAEIALSAVQGEKMVIVAPEDKKEAMGYIAGEPRLLRPANYPAGVPGRGAYVARTGDGRAVGVINIMGRVFMLNIDDPFAVVLREIEAIRHQTRVIIVDFHAEATSEKVAMGWYLDGKVTAVIGTHTHVQTAYERILPGGTAYLTDAGMTGPHDSVIGVKADLAIHRMRTGMPVRFEVAEGGVRIEGALIECGADGRATSIEPVRVDCP